MTVTDNDKKSIQMYLRMRNVEKYNLHDFWTLFHTYSKKFGIDKAAYDAVKDKIVPRINELNKDIEDHAKLLK